ncbi:hypothetical protein HY933_01320 [Candidatus Falkowbacteria bacterium]|nr:hypothetical protein [Candidatus Falkowbacteria bacterium]
MAKKQAKKAPAAKNRLTKRPPPFILMSQAGDGIRFSLNDIPHDLVRLEYYNSIGEHGPEKGQEYCAYVSLRPLGPNTVHLCCRSCGELMRLPAKHARTPRALAKYAQQYRAESAARRQKLDRVCLMLDELDREEAAATKKKPTRKTTKHTPKKLGK